MLLVDAQGIVNKLSKFYQIKPPIVKFKRRRNGKPSNRSHYDWKAQTIKLASWESTIDTLLHEFAHHLDLLRNGGGSHDNYFWWSLVDVITVYYNGNYTSFYGGYKWHKEYSNGKKFYIKLLQLTKEEIVANLATLRRIPCLIS